MQFAAVNILGLRHHTIGTHHFVCKNTVEAIVVEGDQPIKALKLVRAHYSTYN